MAMRVPEMYLRCIASMLCRDLDAFDAASSGVFCMEWPATRPLKEGRGRCRDDILDSVSTAMQWYRNPELIPDSADLWIDTQALGSFHMRM